jgi:hypothetical protein
VSFRSKGHLAFLVLIWPCLTIAGTTIDVLHFPYYRPDFAVGLAASVVTTGLLIPSMVLPGLVFGLLSALVFRLTRADAPQSVRAATAEPALMFLSAFAGGALWYPAVLNQPLLWPLHGLPALGALGLLIGAVGAGARLITRRRWMRLTAATLAVGAALPVPGLIAARVSNPVARPSDTVLLGIDSLSQADDLAALRTWLAASGGAWYERAVAPGLLTNAVWTSILSGRPVSEHGVFVTFQRFPAGQARLLDAARARGYRTVSFFPNQLTCAVGSEAGFDLDHSGPVGWRQIMLPPAVNDTLLVAMLSSALPRLPFQATPRNFAGTFTYDVGLDLRHLLHEGGSVATLVAAHLTYLHEPVYPRWLDLSWTERVRVAGAPVWRIADRSFDAMAADDPADPLALRTWKIAHLERILVRQLTAARARGTRLVMFSDHGDRVGLTPETFSDPRYHHVLLATINVPRQDVAAPISLIAIGSLAGLDMPAHPDPRVEFTVPPASMWADLFRTSHLDWQGAVRLDERLLAPVFAGLREYRPYAASVAESHAAALP